MSEIKVIAGDLERGTYAVKGGFWTRGKLCLQKTGLFKSTEKINLNEQLLRVELRAKSQEKPKDMSKAISIGAAASVLLGPAALAGGIAYGNSGGSPMVGFEATLKDGRKFEAICELETFRKLAALVS